MSMSGIQILIGILQKKSNKLKKNYKILSTKKKKKKTKKNFFLLKIKLKFFNLLILYFSSLFL